VGKDLDDELREYGWWEEGEDENNESEERQRKVGTKQREKLDPYTTGLTLTNTGRIFVSVSD
jgi:hypothetical protein